MADILSQDEIDALLSTVVEDDEDAHGPQDTFDVIPKKISVYDFRRPDRVSKEQIRSIRNLHDKFARNFSSNLSSFLRTITDITLVSADQMTYGEFLMSLPDPTSFNIISMIPLQGNAVLEINPSLIFPIIDKLLGGAGLPLFQVRELTQLEMTIIDGIIQLVLKDLEDVWKQVVPNIRFKKELSENSPHVIQIVAQNEVVMLIVFEVKFGEATGMMNLCLPALVLEPILGKISSQDWLIGAKKGRSGEYELRILELLETISVGVKVELGRTALKMGEILDLQAGDTVILRKKSTMPVNFYVANRHKYYGNLGIMGIKKAVKITSQPLEDQI
ncbi:MAG: flagellar motor switch protein FliM [Deferribacteraceae bacterium]|jgi:flagellar motor switch protein FliM|nr:flagellar motor switch protein FliM [Deferribacteraceae bacterium]